MEEAVVVAIYILFQKHVLCIVVNLCKMGRVMYLFSTQVSNNEIERRANVPPMSIAKSRCKANFILSRQ